MKVKELIAILERCDPDIEVRLAIQPSHSREHPVAGLVTDIAGLATEREARAIEGGDPDLEIAPVTPPRVVYVAAGAWLGYGTEVVQRRCAGREARFESE